MKAVVCITEKPGNVSLISNILQIGQNNVHQCLVVWTGTSKHTLFESENERQKIEPVPIPLPGASRNFPDVKTRNDFFFIIGLRR